MKKVLLLFVMCLSLVCCKKDKDEVSIDHPIVGHTYRWESEDGERFSEYTFSKDGTYTETHKLGVTKFRFSIVEDTLICSRPLKEMEDLLTPEIVAPLLDTMIYRVSQDIIIDYEHSYIRIE